MRVQYICGSFQQWATKGCEDRGTADFYISLPDGDRCKTRVSVFVIDALSEQPEAQVGPNPLAEIDWITCHSQVIGFRIASVDAGEKHWSYILSRAGLKFSDPS